MQKVHLPSVAVTLGPILAAKKGCSVQFTKGIRTAQTNGKVVELPMFVEQGTAEDEKVIRCFLAHEILGHVLQSDYLALNAWAKKGPSKMAISIQNILEDGRIERKAWVEMTQVKRLLSEGVDVLKSQAFFGPDTPKANISKSHIVTATLSRYVRGNYLGQNLSWGEYVEVAKTHLGDDVCDKVLALAMRGASSSSTAEVLAATDEIMAILKEQDQEQPEKDEANDKSGGQDKSEGESEPQQGESQNGSDGEGEGQSQSGEQSGSAGADDESDESADESQGTTGQLDVDDAPDTDLADAVKGLIDEDGKDAPGLGAEPTNRKWSGEIAVTNLDPKKAQRFIPEQVALAASRKMASRLEELLESVTDEGYQLTDQGRLRGDRLTEAMLGDNFVFSVSGAEKEGMSTAISLMIDQSGSMSSDDNMATAKACAFALSECLSRFDGQGMRFEVTAFDDIQRIVKPFNSSWVKNRNNLSVIHANGGTSFLDSAMAVAKRLAVQPEKRKVAFFVTDGDIGSNPKVVFQTLLAQGLEVRVVFLTGRNGQKHAEKMAKEAGVKHWAFAERSEDVPNAVFKALTGTFV